MSKIYYTHTDEAPALATASFLPILRSYAKETGITFEKADISLAGRIIANFPDFVEEKQRIPDWLSILGELCLKPEANIIKLPNISASVPQLKGALKELQSKGYKIPDYPEKPSTPEEKEIQGRFAKVLGSAVNPVLRQGNSDRRAPVSVKAYTQRNPTDGIIPLSDWSKDCKAHISSMTEGDFFGNEKSVTVETPTSVDIIFVAENGTKTVLKKALPLKAGEIIDSTHMSVQKLQEFFAKEIKAAKEQDLLLSLHMKATMMKVSDPIIFGHCVKVYYKDVFEKHADVIAELGVNPNFGLGDLYAKIATLPAAKKQEIEKDIAAVYEKNPKLAMVDSAKGITNLHVPSDIIIDASVPVIVRDGGKMWGPDNKLHETNAMIPDRCYSKLFQTCFDDCIKNGIYDRATMGSVPNVGLMAQKAEEYGSHDKTFEMTDKGVVQIVDVNGKVLMVQNVATGDIFRACQVKDEPIKDWVKLGVTRVKATGAVGVFWLDEKRAHDFELIKKVKLYLKDHDTTGYEILILPPVEACKLSLERIRKGLDTVSITGNVLRDYLTDLFPIIEIGTSAKMLSVVPLLNGGGLFETGAGGSAPKHVQQFLKEGHLRWDSLGEFSALVASFEHLASFTGNKKAQVLSDSLDKAIGEFLENKKSPTRKTFEIDNRGSQLYLAYFWAKELAKQDADAEMKNRFIKIVSEFEKNIEVINKELIDIQGKPVDIGGYFLTDPQLVNAAMCPSKLFIDIIDL